MPSKEKTSKVIKNIILILLFLSLCGLLVYGYFRLIDNYKAWVNNFWFDKSKSIVDLNDDQQVFILNNQTENKITTFSNSTKKTDYMELNISESAYLIGKNINKVSPTYIKISKIFIDTNINQDSSKSTSLETNLSENSWDIYLLVDTPKIKNISIKITIQKDTIETAQLYATDFAIADFSLNEIGIIYFTEKINKGLSDGLLLVNENNYSGRVYKNIELDTDGMVIKGILL